MKGSVALILICLVAALAAAGCSDEVAPLCDATPPCPAGMTCAPATSTCVPLDTDQGGPDATGDKSVTPKPEAGADLLPDLSPDSGPGPDGSPDSVIPDALSDSTAPPTDGGKKALGAACKAAGQCQSGFCAGGVCCDKACGGKCQSCSLKGKEGTCMPLDKTPCGTTACTDGASSSSTTSYSCTSGTCAGSQTSCGTYKCDAAKTACLTLCSPGKGHCIAGYFCNINTCIPKQANGSSCKNAFECLSGVCEEGFCCDKACPGECQSCAIPTTQGTCTFKAFGSACSTASTCTNGATSSEVLTRQCDGKSAACQETKTSCTPYKCTSSGAPKCLSSCTKNDQCLAGICDPVYKPGTCPKLNEVCYVDGSVATNGNGSRATPHDMITRCGHKQLYMAVAPGTYVEMIFCNVKTQPLVMVATVAPASVLGGSIPSVKMVAPDKTHALFVEKEAALHVSGFHVSATSKSLGVSWLNGAKLVLYNCLLSGPGTTSTLVTGIKGMKGTTTNKDATLIMTGCKVTGFSNYGLELKETNAKLLRVDLVQNGSNGVLHQSSTGKHKLTLDQVSSSYNTGNGVVVSGGKLDADRLITAGNTGMGVALLNAPASLVSNLLSVHNGSHGIQSLDNVGGASNTVIANATIAYNSGTEVWVPAASKSSLSFTSSIIWDTAGTVIDGGKYVYSDVAGYLPPGTGNMSKDPKFVDPGKTKKDFRLQAGSPCINAGDPKSPWATSKDLDGNPRLKGTIDMGAYEKQ